MVRAVAIAGARSGAQGDQRDASCSFGSQFLAKIVQMSLALPPPSEEGMKKLLRSVTGRDTADGSSDAAPSVGASEASVSTGTARESGVDRGGYPVEVPEDLRFEPIKRIRDSAEVVEAETAALNYLERNPHQVKRFHNAFRLQLYVASEQSGPRFEMTGD